MISVFSFVRWMRGYKSAGIGSSQVKTDANNVSFPHFSLLKNLLFSYKIIG